VRLYERRPIDIINLWCKGVVKSMKRTYEWPNCLDLVHLCIPGDSIFIITAQ
jgi:hypothetical protein